MVDRTAVSSPSTKDATIIFVFVEGRYLQQEKEVDFEADKARGPFYTLSGIKSRLAGRPNLSLLFARPTFHQMPKPAVADKTDY